ncbi:MAG: MauE/DoxX family redox-associated membrane protein [Pseudodesulfovibrio sp.]|uniref:MauE/DoxX family redox-associated membrane protein n=1 Tax=Pseudodesulfovibrio sp. TaxID=2035812 RepID=UPI003D14CEA8
MQRIWNLTTLFVVLRFLLAVVFIYASIDKILHPADFAAIVKDYKVLPDILINLTAIILPWLELVLGVLLVLGRWQEGTLLLVNLLLVAFWATLVFNYFRGVDVGCGCFSTQATESSNMVWYMVRDGFFVLVGGTTAILFLRTPNRVI